MILIEAIHIRRCAFQLVQHLLKLIRVSEQEVCAKAKGNAVGISSAKTHRQCFVNECLLAELVEPLRFLCFQEEIEICLTTISYSFAVALFLFVFLDPRGALLFECKQEILKFNGKKKL